MTISDYQVGCVIKIYMKSTKEKEDAPTQKPKNDVAAISQEGMKKVLYDIISD
jgi:hypothetical protein